MKVREFFEKYLSDGRDVTFIEAKAEKDEHSPFYHSKYTKTPIRRVNEWKWCTKILESYVLNDNQPPIDWLSGAPWIMAHKRGDLECLLIASKEDLLKEFRTEEQVKSIIKFIDKKIEERRG